MKDDEKKPYGAWVGGEIGRGEKVRAYAFFWSPGAIAGLVIAVVGVLLLLKEFGKFPDFGIGDLWPLALLWVGGAVLRRADGLGGHLLGGLVVLLGVGFLLENFGIWAFDIGRFWPLVIVALGLTMVWGALGGGRHGGGRHGGRGHTVILGAEESAGEDFVNRFVALGGSEIKSDSRNFQGGRLSAIMGGIELDLRGVTMAGDEVVLDVFAMMGGIEIRIPEGWSVSGKVLPILGGFEDNTHTVREPGKTPKRLVIQGTAVMGGVEVKS